ncbi:MAG TPA: HAMP domain-containing sensor histidine kinase [Clostridia bacterium]|nr:HAMP domain-containing sensor histidine kinase [Clostridia bacterium]
MKVSIRYKIFISFSLLIITVFIIMSLVTNITIKSSNETVISKELVKVKDNITVYVRQFFLLSDIEPEPAAFAKHSSEILADLEAKLNIKAVLYTAAGDPAGLDSGHIPDMRSGGRDLSHALNKKLSFTIYSGGDIVKADISVPVVIKGKFLGVISYTKDYSDLYRSGYYLGNILTVTILIMLLIMFIASYVISDGIIRPVTKLNDMAKEIARGEFNGKADKTANDEIGELTSSFIMMKEQIHNSIRTIERDHMLLKELESYRKKFFDNVAHEFKTPLTTIRGYAQVMEDGSFSDKELCRKGTSYILNECDRLYRLVQSLLTISRQTSENIEVLFDEINISKLIADICEEMRLMAASRNMDIHCEISPDIRISGFTDDLKSAFINILDNAIKFGTEASVIEVKVYAENGQANVSVTNKGCGLPADKLDKVFDPFFRIYAGSGRSMGGSGLGLSIVKAIIEKHRGTIKIESTENVFAKVTAEIPQKDLQF